MNVRSCSVYSKLTWAYFAVAASLLLLGSVAKLVSVFGRSAILDIHDPVFLLSYRTLMVCGAVIEGIAGTVILKSSQLSGKGWILVWVTAIIAAYRCFALLHGPMKLCPCLGSLGDLLSLDPRATEKLSLALLGYLGAGAALFLASTLKCLYRR